MKKESRTSPSLSLPSRRHLLKAAAGGVACAAIGAAPFAVRRAQAQAGAGANGGARAAASPGSISSIPLSEALHVLTVDQSNLLAMTDRNGIVLVDGGSAASAGAVFNAVSALGDGGIHTLFNTHWHAEQTGLNERIGSAGAKIIAQENTRLWLSTDITYPWDGQRFEPLPAVAQPNETFFNDGELSEAVHYGYLRHAAHTDGDLYVNFRDANVLAVGGAATGAGWPLVDWWTGGWIGGIVGTLELLLAMTNAETRIVPAHGAILTRSELAVQYEMYNTIFERLARLLNSGRGPDEAVAARPTEEFDARMGPSEPFVRRAFESLWAYLSPDA
jgi:glyoxylase-like metal-dependent hydrolase (beta-lactamase superfamily II)